MSNTQAQVAVLEPPAPLEIKPPITLDAPQLVAVPDAPTAQMMIRLDPTKKAKVETQLASYVSALMEGDPNSEEFRNKVDQAFSLGNEQLAAAATVSNRFTKQNMKGIEDTHAYKAVASLRNMFEELNPAREGDLFAPNKILGFIPGGNKLKGYLRRYESAESQMDKITAEVVMGRDEIGRDIAELRLSETQFYEAIQKLTGAEEFLTGLNRELSSRIAALRTSDPERARAFEQEVLYYASKNLENIVTLKGVTIGSLLMTRELQKTGREIMRGCDEMTSLGRAALSQAVMLARATGNQIAVGKMLAEGKQTIRGILDNNAKAFGEHVSMVTKQNAEPVVMAQQLQRLFTQTLGAADILAKYRSDALQVTQQNILLIQEANNSAMRRIEAERNATKAAAPAKVLDLD